MNKCYFTGRTTKDVEVRYTAGEKQTAVGKFSLAVDTGYGDNKKANFFNMTAWGKTAEAMEKNVRKGTKIVVECEANQNSYTDKNGNKVYYTEFVADAHEFCESKGNNNNSGGQQEPPVDNDGFMQIPDGVAEELPFN